MSTDQPDPLSNLPVASWADALAQELVRYKCVASGNAEKDEPQAVVTPDELLELCDGALTQTEVKRLQRLVILEMLGHSVPIREIRQRLRVGQSRFDSLMRGILKDGMGDDAVDQMRAVEKIHLDRIDRKAEEAYNRTHNPAFLKIQLDASDARCKLFGLNKPIPMEVHETKQVSVELRVITSRQHLEEVHRNEQPEALLLDSIDGMMPAEAVSDAPEEGHATDGETTGAE